MPTKSLKTILILITVQVRSHWILKFKSTWYKYQVTSFSLCCKITTVKGHKSQLIRHCLVTITRKGCEYLCWWVEWLRPSSCLIYEVGLWYHANWVLVLTKRTFCFNVTHLHTDSYAYQPRTHFISYSIHIIIFKTSKRGERFSTNQPFMAL